MTTPRLGFLTHVHGTSDVRPNELYPAIVDLFVAAEELGFHSGWVAQHHLQTLQGRLPSPLVLLSGIATRTSVIRLGTAIVVLPLEDPVRLAEDAAVLDALADGRLELGLGSGGPSAEQFAAFARDPEQRHDLYRANLERLDRALGGEQVADGLTLEPPAPTLGSRIWESPSRPETAAAAARSGRGVLLGLGPAEPVQREIAEAYGAAWCDGSRIGPPRIAAVRGAFPASDRATARAALAPDVARHLGYHVQAGWLGEDASLDELLHAMNVQYGRPEDIVATLLRDPVLPHASDLIFAVQAESTSVSSAVSALERLAAEVAPALAESLG